MDDVKFQTEEPNFLDSLVPGSNMTSNVPLDNSDLVSIADSNIEIMAFSC